MRLHRIVNHVDPSSGLCSGGLVCVGALALLSVALVSGCRFAASDGKVELDSSSSPAVGGPAASAHLAGSSVGAGSTAPSIPHDARTPRSTEAGAFVMSAQPQGVDGGAQVPSYLSAAAWAAGDYPDDIMSDNFLKLGNLTGQRGFVRQFKVHVPSSYRKDQPMPLVFCMHGLYQDPVMFCVVGSELVQRSDRDDFIIAMPAGYSGSWNAGRCCGDARDMKLDDVAFIRGVFDELKKHLNIALDRVYAVGFANGGFMTHRLVCEAADLFSAVVVGSGGLGVNAFDDVSASNPDLLSNQSDFEDCKPSRAIPILHIHGSMDELVPPTLQPKSLAYQAHAAGCAATQSVVAATTRGDTKCSTFDGCPIGVEITGCTVEGGGHCWFGQDDCGTGAGAIGALFTGANSAVIRNTQAAIDFLHAYGL